MRPAPGGGLAALPLPTGEPAGLWAAATVLRAAAAAVSEAPLARSGGRLPLTGWSGDAATSAQAELVVVAALETAAADRLVRAAVVLTGYADELDAAQRSVATLQGSWDAALPADPLAPLPDASLSVIATTYGVVTAELQLAADVAAHRLRSLAGEVVTAEHAGRSGSHTLGWADPPPSDAAVRTAVLGALPVVAGVAARREADRLADQVLVELQALLAGDGGAAGRVAARLGVSSRDPVVAQALWERLDPDVTGRLVDVLTGFPRDPASAAVLVQLGSALAVAANPAYAAGADPVTRSRLAAWREPWLAGLADGIGSSGSAPEGRPIAPAWVQGVLLTGAGRAGLSPGSRYAATVGVALVAADRAMLASTGPTSGGLSGPGSADRDPVLALARALAGDTDAARAWLLAPLAGPDRKLVVEHLAAGRYAAMDPTAAGASMAATTRLVAAAGADAADRDGVTLDAAFLGAIGSEAQTTSHPDAYRVALAPALGGIGTILARHPDALTAALDESAAPGVDADMVTDADRLTRSGRAAGTWEAVLPGRSASGALLGVLAFDSGPARSDLDPSWDRPWDHPAPRHPATPPAVSQVLGALGTRLEADLIDAVAADVGGDPHALDAAARRLGEVVGFTLTSAGEGLARRDADIDERNRVVAGLAEGAVAKVILPGAARVATPLVRMAADRVITATLPTDNEAAQRRATTRSTDAATDATAAGIRALVSRAHPWTEEQSPRRWANGGGAVSFWDHAGIPLPETEMTTAQRRAFTAWRRDAGLSVYDTAPALVQDGVDAGVRAAVRAAS